MNPPPIDPLRSLVDEIAAARASLERIEGGLIPLLERIALALERGGLVPGSAGPAPPPDDVAEARAAIQAGDWDRASALVAALHDRGEARAEHEAAVLGHELAQARERATGAAVARVEAARAARDAAGALAARDDLAQLLAPEALAQIDRPLVGWLMRLVQQRLRSVPIAPDVAQLVGQVVDRFGGTPEGASLRAALPTLRRSAGLCPRCGEPDGGDDDACPRCLDQTGQAPSEPPILAFVAPPEDDLDAIVVDERPFDLNDARHWHGTDHQAPDPD